MAMTMTMANLKKVVSFIVSHSHSPRNKFKGSITTHSSLVSLSKTSSSFLEKSFGICPPKTKTISAPFYSTLSSNRQKSCNRCIIFEKCDDTSYAQKVCKPTAAVKSTIKEIKRLCSFGRIDSAIALFEELGFKPDVATYTILIDSLFQVGRQDYAFKLYREMAFHHGILPTHANYKSLLHHLRILSRRGYDITKLLKDMEDQGVLVEFTTFKIFVDAYCKEGRLDEAESLLKLMFERGISPYAHHYTLVIQGYCLQGNMNKAREVFDSMRCRRVTPSVDAYNSLVKGYCQDSKIEEAMHLFHEMLKSVEIRKHDPTERLFSRVPIPDECTYKIVLEALCNNNQVEEAVSLFHSMELDDSYELDSNPVDLYNILIEGARRSGKLGIARSLYNEMTITKGLQPNDVTYVAMIEVFCEEGLDGEAKKLFIEMKERDIWPINCACFLLLIRFLRNKHRDLLEMLLLEMERRGYEIDASATKIKLSEDGSFLYLTSKC